MDDETVSTREAAVILGVCVRTVQLWVESGRLQAWKTPGGHRRISRKSVEKELRSRVSKRAEPVADFDVLIVEDERIQRKAFQNKIAAIDRDISVRTAENGVEGLIRIGEKQPQVLITDLMMPGLDGFHMLGTLVSGTIGRKMQIVVVTGLSDAEIVGRGGVPEGVIVLRKPVQVDVLASLVRSYFDGWILRRRTV